METRPKATHLLWLGTTILRTPPEQLFLPTRTSIFDPSEIRKSEHLNLYFMRYNSKAYDFWSNEDENIEFVFSLKRGAQRRKRLKDVILAVLRNLGMEKPTTRELQKLTRIRRATFLPLLRDLISNCWVQKHGSGTRSDPYRYSITHLAPKTLIKDL